MSEENVRVMEWGLKENFKHFKVNFDFCFGGHLQYVKPFFAYDKHDLDMAYAFENEHQLQVFLERVWYDDMYCELEDTENSMDNWIVWKFVGENEVKKWPILHPKVKSTSIVCKGEKVLRQLYEIKIEPCIHVNLNRK